MPKAHELKEEVHGWYKQRPVKTFFTIITDTQSMILKIFNGLQHEWLPSIISSNVQEMIWSYCMRHASKLGNERDDSLASKHPIKGH